MLYFISVGYKKLRQKLCFHKWCYDKRLVLVGRPHAQYSCSKCGKVGHLKYSYEYECTKGFGAHNG
jgi:hypothetical protein